MLNGLWDVFPLRGFAVGDPGVVMVRTEIEEGEVWSIVRKRELLEGLEGFESIFKHPLWLTFDLRDLSYDLFVKTNAGRKDFLRIGFEIVFVFFVEELSIF